MTYIYLASPYSDPSPKVRRLRYLEAEACMYWLLTRRTWAFSPIVQCHFLAEGYELPKGADFWRGYTLSMLDQARELWILTIPGHTTSKGIKMEIEHAKLLKLPMCHITPRFEGHDYTITSWEPPQ